MRKITFFNLITKNILLLLFFLLYLNNSLGQYYIKHNIAPSPWSYYSQANELIITTESISNVSITVSKSDGTFITNLTAKKGTPVVYRFEGNPLNKSNLSLNTVLNAEGLIITGSQPISINLRTVSSDNIPGDQNIADNNIKGNASLTSFGNPGLGVNFRIGYYRDGKLGTFSVASIADQSPIYSVMATKDATIVKLNNSNLITLNAGQSYLFQAAIGSLVESNQAVVMNTGSRLDNPDTCGDGTVDQIPPTNVLGKEYIIVRTLGINKAEQTTIVATENNTKIEITTYSNTGVLSGTITRTLQAGNFFTFDNGVSNVDDNNPALTAYSSSRIVSDKKIAVYSGSAQSCEVDISSVAPTSECGGSNYVETTEFKNYDNTNLPYFGFVLVQDAGSEVKLNGTNLESLTSPRIQLGTTGWYLIKFDNNQINSPNIISISSTKKVIVSIVQQGGGFSMSAYFSNFIEQPGEPILKYTQVGNCTNGVATLTTTPGLIGYQWFLNGNIIPGATSNEYIATENGGYTVEVSLLCGEAVQSTPVTVKLCTDLEIVKTVNNATPEVCSDVIFTLTAKNLGPNTASDVVVNDILPAGYTFVSATTTSGTWTNSNWNIGTLNKDASVTMTIVGSVNNAGSYSNTATISSANDDNNQDNNSSTAVTNPITLSPPVSGGDQIVCGDGTNTQTITATATGKNITWFSVPTGGTAIISPTLVGVDTKTYYAQANTCISSTRTAVKLTIIAPPTTPTVTVVDNCNGTSTLTASNYTGSLLWNTGATTASITVTTAATYTVTQTINDCTSLSGSGIAAPKTKPAKISTIISICSGESYIWAVNGTAYSGSGTYLIANDECTANQELILSVTPKPTKVSTPITICSGESYTWAVNGTAYTTSGTYLVTNNGCTANQELVLTVTPKPTKVSTPITICSGESYNWAINGTTYTTSGTYLVANNGCTANQELILTVTNIIIANDDAGTSVNGPTGGISFTNVLSNDILNCKTAVIDNVNLSFVSSTNPGITLSGANVIVAPGTPAGSYTLIYQICEKLNPTNCYSATVTITVTAPATPVIIAQDDKFIDIDGANGNSNAGNVLNDNGNGNDTLNGVNITIDQVNLTVTIPAVSIGGAPVPVIDNATGQVSIPAGTPAGTYTIIYSICDKSSLSNCDTATVTIEVALVLGVECEAIVVHKAFSPNGDGTNEKLVIDGVDSTTCYPSGITVEIYNRWGVLVFETKNYNNETNAFEGYSKGRTTISQSEGLPTGTYFYILNYESFDGTGNVQIKKQDGFIYLSR